MQLPEDKRFFLTIKSWKEIDDLMKALDKANKPISLLQSGEQFLSTVIRARIIIANLLV
jgi:hypothetical protein